MTDLGPEQRPTVKPEDPAPDNPATEPEKDHPITEDPDGTPVENPSGG